MPHEFANVVLPGCLIVMAMYYPMGDRGLGRARAAILHTAHALRGAQTIR